MTTTDTPEKDPIQDLMEKKQAKIEDVEDKGKEKETGKQVEETKEDLKKEKETTQTQQEIKEELSVFSLITRTEVLIENFKRIEKEAKKLNKNKENKGDEGIQKAQAKVQIDELENMKNILKRYKRKGDNLSQESLNIYDKEIKNKEEKLKQFEGQRDKIVLNQAGGSTIYEIEVNTLKDALKLEKNINKIKESLREIDKVLRRAELSNEIKEELKGLKYYLESAIENSSSPMAPFELKHRKDIQKLNVIDPALYYLIEENVHPSPQVTTKDPNNNNRGGNPNNNSTANIPNCPNGIVVPTYNNTNRKETFEQGGIKGIFRKAMNFTKMNEGQKDSWTNGLFLVGIGLAIWQGGKWLLKGKEKGGMSFWTKAAIIGGAFFGANALTGKSLPELVKGVVSGGLDLDWLKTNKIKSDAEKIQEMEIHVQAPAMASLVLGNNKLSDLENVLDKDFKLKDYDQLLNTYRNSSKTEEQELGKELERIGKEDKEGKIKSGLATMGITPENYKNLDQNKTVLDYFKIYTSNTNTFENYIKDKKLVLVNGKEAERDALIRSGKSITNDDMKKLEDSLVLIPQNNVEGPIDNEVFDITKDDKLNLKTQVDKFSIDQITKDKLIKYGNLLYIDIPGGSSKIPEFKEYGGYIYLKNYGEWTKIDVKNKSLLGLSDTENNTIKFDNTMEMMKVANLTNYIKSLFRGRKTGTTKEDYHPFRKSSITDLIDGRLNGFADLIYVTEDKDKSLKRYNPKKYGRSDLEVIDGGWFGDLKAVSPVLNKNIDEYAEYLNTLDIWKQDKKTNDLPT